MDADQAHDEFIWAAHLFRFRPTFVQARAVERAYRVFHLAFSGAAGIEDACRELRGRLARELITVRAA